MAAALLVPSQASPGWRWSDGPCRLRGQTLSPGGYSPHPEGGRQSNREISSNGKKASHGTHKSAAKDCFNRTSRSWGSSAIQLPMGAVSTQHCYIRALQKPQAGHAEECTCSTDTAQVQPSSIPKHGAIPAHKGPCTLQGSTHGMLEWFGLEETLKTT